LELALCRWNDMHTNKPALVPWEQERVYSFVCYFLLL
jgi:hypothetical protein